MLWLVGGMRSCLHVYIGVCIKVWYLVCGGGGGGRSTETISQTLRMVGSRETDSDVGEDRVMSTLFIVVHTTSTTQARILCDSHYELT